MNQQYPTHEVRVTIEAARNQDIANLTTALEAAGMKWRRRFLHTTGEMAGTGWVNGDITNRAAFEAAWAAQSRWFDVVEMSFREIEI